MMEVVLTVTDGPHQGREFTFAEHDTFLVGRSKRAHFQLVAKDMYFSRLHFLVEVNPPRVRVIDMKSRNGTWVNGQRVPSADLKDGDKIKAGHTILRVALRYGPGEKPEEALTVAPPPPAASAGTAATQAASPVIPGYHLERELGRGGMGVVYLAREEASEQAVALKTITPAVTPTGSQVERFLREARILEQLRHPNIVAFRAMGEAGGLLWFAMEYVPGTDAARLLREEGPLPVKTAVRMICHVLQALEHAHAKGFVHRDIKPANILLEIGQGDKETGRQGDTETRRLGAATLTAILADFGLARVYQTSQISGLTLAGDIGGTAKFMPPEQITNYREVKPPADQYSVAATLYNLLTGAGVYDFKGGGIEAIAMILDEDPVPIQKRRPELVEKLAAVIHKALAREPGDRFADVSEFRKALLPFSK
jgi:eukaryotic-like serine/threonine-protein kinase